MDGQTETLVQEMPKQARSRARRLALIEHGAHVLNRQELDEVSISELTGELGFSTGSFYSYFRDKEDFFVAVQIWVDGSFARVFGTTVNSDQLHNKPLTARLRVCVHCAIRYFREWCGVIRSALRYERRIPEGWAPNRARTRDIIEKATQGLNVVDRSRLETALQLAYGLLVNALLHDPGPLRLDDPDLEDRIVKAMSPFLETSQST